MPQHQSRSLFTLLLLLHVLLGLDFSLKPLLLLLLLLRPLLLLLLTPLLLLQVC
jgi:hypothetical protein